MLTKHQGFEKVFSIASTNFVHQDYDRTVELHRMYKAFITGEDAAYLLHRFNLREDETMFAQRMLLTQLITPAICSILTSPAQKIPSVKPLVKEAGYTVKKEREEAILRESINNFWGDQSLDEYLRDNFLTASDVDPNSFMIIKFNSFDGRYQRPEVYATIVGCESIVDFEYANNVLQYLVVRRSIKYDKYYGIGSQRPKKLAQKDGYFYQMYVDDYEIELTQVDVEMLKSGKELLKNGNVFEMDFAGAAINVIEVNELTIKNVRDDVKYYTLASNGKLFEITFYHTKAGRVPAIRTGVNRDVYTDGRTCVNQFHSSVPYLMKSVKTVSELDLSQSLHVFLQKFTYAPKCMGYTNAQQQHIDCMGGNDPMGNQCQMCKGSGIMVHTTAQDHIQLGLPKDPNQAFDLSKLVYYADIPIDIVKWLDEYLDGLVTKAVNARFSSTMFVEQSIVKTATEKTYDMETVYDALAPQASQYSRAWLLAVRMTAIYKSIDKDLFINHVFPQDWKMESVQKRMDRLKQAVDAGANQYTISYLQNDLMDAVYADQPYRLKEFKTMEYFNPFSGINDNEVRQKISAGLVTEYDQVLYANLKRIITQAASQNIGSETSPSFYDMTREKQDGIVKAITEVLITELNAQRLARQATMTRTFENIPVE